MPKPKTGESHSTFVNRCIPVVMSDGTATNPAQAVAVCESFWKEGRTMATLEHRVGVLVELRADGEPEGRILAEVMRYNTVDTYRTTFAPGVFTDSLSERLPRMLWVHDLSEPIGRWTDVDDNSERLRLAGELDLDPDVPLARRALAQMRSGTLQEFSVGFSRQADEADPANPGATRITRALLPEVSPTPVGSVPGTKLVSVRSGDGSVDLDAVVELARRLDAGELTKAEALAAIDLIGTGTDIDAGNGDDSGGSVGTPDPAVAEAVAEAEAILDASL